MVFPGFVGPTYTAQGPLADCEVAMNLYPEVIAGGATGKSQVAYYRTPGKRLLGTLPKAPLRGFLAGDHRCFAVAKDTVYEVFQDGTSTAFVGAVIDAATPAQIIPNGTQLFIVSGNQGYLINDGVNVVPIRFMDPDTGAPTGDLLRAVMGAVLDGYFIAAIQDSQYFYVSDNSSGLGGYSWNPLTFGKKESSPDNIGAIAVSHQELWLLGNLDALEVWDDNGAPPPGVPFTRNAAGSIEQAIVAPWSLVKMDDESLMWLGTSPRGGGVVWRSQGYAPVRVSTHAVETAIQGYLRIDDAVAYSYQEEGHSNYVISFPSATASAGATWCFDATVGMWHQRGVWNSAQAQYTCDLARFHAYAFGMHLVGGGDGTGNIYVQALSIQDDAGLPIRWWRRAPHVNDEAKWVRHNSLQIDMQVGVSGQGQDSTVSMRYSNDGSMTWSSEKTKSAGRVGEYRARVIWYQLGRARDRVYEIYGTDPSPVCIVAAYLNIAEFPQQDAKVQTPHIDGMLAGGL